jgi:hypothetical protein
VPFIINEKNGFAYEADKCIVKNAYIIYRPERVIYHANMLFVIGNKFDRRERAAILHRQSRQKL